MYRLTDLLTVGNSNGFCSVLAKAVGLNEAIILNELIAERDILDKKHLIGLSGSFYSTVANVQEATTLSGRQQKTAINHLEELGFIKCWIQGIPAVRHFIIYDEVVMVFLSDLRKK